MKQTIAITRDKSDDIGFVITSLFCSAISLAELHGWCYEVIERLEPEDLPAYIFELSKFEGKLASVFKVVGFVPSWAHTEDDEAALCGVGMDRGGERLEWPISREAALAALHRNPGIVKRFRSTFPFIAY